MSGIAGYYSNNKATKKILKSMTDRIEHRGKDAEGLFVEDNIALGHRLLKTNNKIKGEFPIFNKTKDIIVVSDSVINNYQELKSELESKKYKFETNLPEEVLVHGYEEWGHELTKKIRGSFAFAIYNKKDNELYLARDGWGVKPIYYYAKDDTFLFASEIKAFLDHPEFIKEFNDEILSAYLCFNSVPTEETFFKGVKRIEPGYQLIYKDNKINLEKFFSLKFTEELTDTEKASKLIAEAMEDSIKRNFDTEVPMGSLLSSGVDSSYIVSLAKPEKTFTVGYDNQKYNESTYAKDLADKLGIKNITQIVSQEEYIKNFPKLMYHMDEPLADPSTIALYSVTELASKHVKILTSGEGADELFGGYNTYQEELNQAWYMKIPFPIRRLASMVAGIFPEVRGFNFIWRRGQKLENYNIGLGRVFRDEEAMKLVKPKNQIHTKDIVAPFYKEYKNNSTMIQRQMIDYYFWLVRDFLHAVDRNTTMFGIEGRTPFLDTKVYEVASLLATNTKIDKQTTKIALRKAAETVIPNESYKKKKLGFPVPLREWVREEDLYSEIKDKFNSKVADKYFDTKKINKLLEDHKNGKKDCYKKVWAIYTFIIWYNQYFEE